MPACAVSSGMEKLAYGELDFVRDAVVAKLRSLMLAGAGTEARRSALMRLRPEDVGLKDDGDSGVLNHFKVTVLSEGSGVQFFSTTFVQWAAREVLRRAQPVTLVARFAPRLTERSMNGAMIGRTRRRPSSMPQGALDGRRYGRVLHLAEPDAAAGRGPIVFARLVRESRRGAGHCALGRPRCGIQPGTST